MLGCSAVPSDDELVQQISLHHACVVRACELHASYEYSLDSNVRGLAAALRLPCTQSGCTNPRGPGEVEPPCQ